MKNHLFAALAFIGGFPLSGPIPDLSLFQTVVTPHSGVCAAAA